MEEKVQYKLVMSGYDTLYFDSLFDADMYSEKIQRSGNVPEKMSCWYKKGKSWKLAWRLI